MNEKRYLFLICFVLCLLISPVMSYSILDTYNVTLTDYGTIAQDYIFVSNHIENYVGVKEIVVENCGIFDYGADISKSVGVWYFDSAHYGTKQSFLSNATMERICSIHSSYSADCDLTYTFLNLTNITGHTGQGGLFFDGAGIIGASYTGVLPVTTGYKAGFSPDSSAAKVLWGTYVIYGDAPPLPQYNYSIDVEPNIQIPNGNLNVTIIGNSSTTMNFYGLYYLNNLNGNSGVLQDKSYADRALSYQRIGTNWFQFDNIAYDYTHDIGVTLPISPIFALPELGDYTINAYITDLNGELHQPYDMVTIQSALNETLPHTNYTSTEIEVIDGKTGGLINGASVQIKVISLGSWINGTATDGTFEFSSPSGAPFDLYAQAYGLGYSNASRKNLISSLTGELKMLYDINLFPIVSTGTNVTFYTTVYDSSSLLRIPNVWVKASKVSNSSDYVSSLSDGNGISVLSLMPTTSYNLQVSKTGYTSQTKSITTTASLSASTEIYLTKATSTTVTPLPTTQNYITGGGGAIGGNITPATCQNPLPAGSTFLDGIKNNIACAGVTSGANQGYIIAIGIIGILAMFGGKYGKGTGALIGVVAGYVICLGMGLVPLWTFIAILVLAGMLFGYKMIDRA